MHWRCRRCADRSALGSSSILAYVEAQRGNFQTARDYLSDSEDMANEMGRLGYLVQLAITRGLVERFARRFDRSVAAFRFAFGEETRIADGLGSMRHFLLARLAQALLDAGHASEARTTLDEAASLRVPPDPWTDTIAGGTDARLLVIEGRANEGLELAKEVVNRARDTKVDRLVILFANALEDLATCAGFRGRLHARGRRLGRSVLAVSGQGRHRRRRATAPKGLSEALALLALAL